jgi:hypothetical protein
VLGIKLPVGLARPGGPSQSRPNLVLSGQLWWCRQAHVPPPPLSVTHPIPVLVCLHADLLQGGQQPRPWRELCFCPGQPPPAPQGRAHVPPAPPPALQGPVRQRHVCACLAEDVWPGHLHALGGWLGVVPWRAPHTHNVTACRGWLPGVTVRAGWALLFTCACRESMACRKPARAACGKCCPPPLWRMTTTT